LKALTMVPAYAIKKIWKRFFSGLKLIAVCLAGIALILLWHENAWGRPTENNEVLEPEVSAETAVLMDGVSRRVLFNKNAHWRRPMASTTKIMTAILAMEKGDLEEVIEVSEKAANTGGSSVWLEAGETKTLEELLYGLMLRSGNDAAVAIAEHIGGSVEEFTSMMTCKAKEIGATNTSFKNPHGLHHEEHYTTAYDMALIAAHAMNHHTFYRISSSPWAVISWSEQEWDRVLYNQNKLLESYRGADGVKTGWTTPAGRCFVGSATRDDYRLIVAVLNAPDMWEDATKLLDYGYEAFQRKKLISQGQVVKTVEVKYSREKQVEVMAQEDVYYPLKPGEKEKIRYLFKLAEPYTAPLKSGEVMGEMKMIMDGEEIDSVALTVTEDVLRAPFYENLLNFILEWV